MKSQLIGQTRALAAYDQMVKTGLANLQQKKEKEKLASDSVTVKTKKETVTVTVQQMNEPAAFQNANIHGTKRTGVGVQLVFTVTDGKGKPLEGATVVESVSDRAGQKVIQNPDEVALDSQGRGSDCVTNSAPDPTNRREAKALYDRLTGPLQQIRNSRLRSL